MVSGTNGKLSLAVVIGCLGNGSEFIWIERNNPMSRIIDCTYVAIGQVREVGAHLKGRCRHLSINRKAPNTIQPFFESGVGIPKWKGDSTK